VRPCHSGNVAGCRIVARPTAVVEPDSFDTVIDFAWTKLRSRITVGRFKRL
jgi:hypothetical protein